MISLVNYIIALLLIAFPWAQSLPPRANPQSAVSSPHEHQTHNYKWSYAFIEELLQESNTSTASIKTILEIGSRDLLDANNLAHHFHARVFAFEGNPDNYERMELHHVDQRVHIVYSAVSRSDDNITFFPLNLTLYRNAGAGGLYMMDFNGRDPRDKDYRRPPVQYAVSVPSTRLDTFLSHHLLAKVDIICMDVQESELEVLKSAGKRLKDVRFIVSEASTVSTYHRGNNFTSLHSFLVSEGFVFIAHHLSGRRESDRRLPALDRRQELDVLYFNPLWTPAT